MPCWRYSFASSNIDRFKAWNIDSGGTGAAFELFIVDGALPEWNVSTPAADKVWVDISRKPTPASSHSLFVKPKANRPDTSPGNAQPELVEEPVIELQGHPEGAGESTQPGPDLREHKTLKIDPMEFSLQWPGDADKLLEELRRITSGIGPGVTVEIPIKLRLYTGTSPYGSAYPSRER